MENGPYYAKPDTIVFWERPRCPRCGSAKLKTTASRDNGDETRTRNTVCRTCKHRFKLVVE